MFLRLPHAPSHFWFISWRLYIYIQDVIILNRLRVHYKWSTSLGPIFQWSVLLVLLCWNSPLRCGVSGYQSDLWTQWRSNVDRLLAYKRVALPLGYLTPTTLSTLTRGFWLISSEKKL